MMRFKGLTEADVSAAGGHFADGFYHNDRERHKAMMRPADLKIHHALHARARQHFGLGDAVASVAQPIARVLDRALGTHIENCGGCKQRRDALNRIVPNF